MSKKIISLLLSVLMLLTLFNCITVSAAEEEKTELPKINIALGKKVTVSDVEGGFNADGTPVYAAFDPQNATDGIYGYNSRVSLGYGDPQWIEVDLGKVYNIGEAVIGLYASPLDYQLEYRASVEDEWAVWERKTSSSVANKTDTITSAFPLEARYVRIYQNKGKGEGVTVNGVATTYSGIITEIEIYEFVGPVNLALGKVVTASGIEGGYNADGTLVYTKFDPKYATDGNTTGNKVSLAYGNPQWIEIDLGDYYFIDKAVLYFGNTPQNYSIQYLTADGNWVSVADRTGTNVNYASVDEITFSYVNTRYIRFYQTLGQTNSHNGQNYSAGVYEIQIFEYDGPINIALGKKVTVSDVEGGFNADGTPVHAAFDPQNATDGIYGYSSRVSLGYGDPQWIEVDLGKVYNIGEAVIGLYGAPLDYQLEYRASTNDEWVVWRRVTGTSTSARNDIITSAEPLQARYVRIYQNKGKGEGVTVNGVATTYSGIINEIEIYEHKGYSYQNLALNTPVTASGIEGGYNADGTLVHTKFDPKYATDGNTTGNKVSLAYGNPQWIEIDLGDYYFIDKAVLYFGNTPQNYSIQYLDRDGNWASSVTKNRDTDTNSSSTEEVALPSLINARYVRFYQNKGQTSTTGSTTYSAAVFEFEVYGYKFYDLEEIKEEATITDIEDLSKNYDGVAVSEPEFITNSDGEVKIEWYKNSVAEENKLANAPADAGTYWVVVNVAESNAYTAVSAQKSFAITYAKGDINSDYALDAKDLAQLRKELLTNNSYNEDYDINRDGEVNILDLIRLKKMVAGYKYDGISVSDGEHIINERICIGGVSVDSDAVVVSGDAKVTIEGGYYDGGHGASNTAVWAKENAIVIINDGKFTVGADAKGDYNDLIYARDNATVIINGGFFEATTPWSANGKYYVLNVRNDSNATITVSGGTFVNYNPADGDDVVEGAITVADGYTVTSETQENGDIWYTVVPVQ